MTTKSFATFGTLRMILMWGTAGLLLFADYQVAMIVHIFSIGVAMPTAGCANAENFFD